MSNNNEHIKKLMDDFQVEGYNLSTGWNKLERKIHPQKKVIKWLKYAAAACLVLMTFTYFLISNYPEKQSQIAFQAKDSLILKTNNGAEKKIIKANPDTAVNNSPQIYSAKTTVVIKHLNTQNKSPVKSLEVEKKVEGIENHQAEIVKIEIQKVSFDNQIVQNTEQKKDQKTITILTEDEFASIMNIEEPQQKKQNTLTKYLASRSRQLEYSGEKLSSQTTLIKF